MTQPETVRDDIDGAAGFLLDAAPVERAYMDWVFTELAAKIGDFDFLQTVKNGCFAYARAAAERAFALGLELGREAVRYGTPAADECERAGASGACEFCAKGGIDGHDHSDH